MAWGIFNKIKKGFKKIGNVFKKGVNFLNEKVIQPFKPLIRQVANKFVPGGGAIVDGVADAVDAVDRFANRNTNIRLRQ